MFVLFVPPSKLSTIPTQNHALSHTSQMCSWTDPGKILKLPPVAVLALHFVLVDLPARLRTPITSSTRPAARPAIINSDRRGSPSRIGDCKPRMGSMAAASLAVSYGKGGGASAGRSGVGNSGGRSASGSVGGVGGGGGDQLGDMPSYVFHVVLPSDPAFDAEVRDLICLLGFLRHSGAVAWQRV